MYQDLAKGSITKGLLLFAAPMVAGNLLQQLYNIADTLIVGQALGRNALASVGSAFTLMTFLTSVFLGLSMGAGALFSIYQGRGDQTALRRAAVHAFALILAVTLVLALAVYLRVDPILRFLQIPSELYGAMRTYLLIIFAGLLATFLYNFFACLLRAVGNSVAPLWFLGAAALLNIGLDLACIILFNMGVFGAAFATVFSQAVAGIGSLIYIMRHYPELRWNKEEGRISAPHCAKLCAMGLPMGLQCSITAIGSVVLQGAVNGLGSDIVAAQTAGGKAAQFLSVPLESIGTAMTTYTSQNMGAKDLGRVNRGVNTALGIGCVYSVASFLILRVLDKPLIGLFLDAGETAIMANAQDFIFWNSVFYIPLAVLIIYRYTIQGLGHSGLAMFAGVAEMIARAMVGFWFVPLWGYFAACIASPVAWLFACFFLIPAYFVVFRRLQKEKQQEAAAKVQ